MSRPDLPDPAESTELVVRPATEADVAQIVELVLAARRDLAPAVPMPPQSPAQLADFWRSRIVLSEGWVVEVDPVEREGEVAGCALVQDEWLHSLYVGPHHQGRGVGSVLLDLVTAIRPDGFGLWVFAANDGARGFYRRHGLLELEHTDGSGSDEQAPEIRMVWPGREPLETLRGQVDEVDEGLALLLARRFALTAAIQGEKRRTGAPAGPQGRDRDREREIVERMVLRSPGLDPDRLSRIMQAVIAESLEQWQRGTSRPGDPLS